MDRELIESLITENLSRDNITPKIDKVAIKNPMDYVQSVDIDEVGILYWYIRKSLNNLSSYTSINVLGEAKRRGMVDINRDSLDNQVKHLDMEYNALLTKLKRLKIQTPKLVLNLKDDLNNLKSALSKYNE